jgi:2-polyprenyl-3-methyl-5-hydroxy-6-metoxy-1,4-benzoquinol methylase
MSLYSILKKTWHTVLPHKLRLALFNASPDSVRRLRRKVIAGLEQTAEHNEIYDGEYYAKLVDPTMQVSARAMAGSIIDAFRPGTVVDVGCGTGLLMMEFQSRGVPCSGLEYSDAAIATCRKRGLNVTQFDIEKNDPPAGLRADLVISTEVAEHLPEKCADRFLDLLTSISDNVVLTAAEPGSAHSSTDHVNEQPLSYWIDKMERRGFTYLRERSDSWRREWEPAGVAYCFFHSIMAFSRSVPQDGRSQNGAPARGMVQENAAG